MVFHAVENFLLTWPIVEAAVLHTKDLMSNVEDNKEQGQMDVDASDESNNIPSSQKQVLFRSYLLACLN